MNTITRFIIPLLLLTLAQFAQGQEPYERRIENLEQLREQVPTQEKEALKQEILGIEERLIDGEISEAESRRLKEEAAGKRARNIEDRLAMIEREIALLERNEGDVLGTGRRYTDEGEVTAINIRFNDEDIFGWRKRDHPVRYDRRTYSDLVVAVGFNNALAKGRSLEESPYKLAGSRFFEIGWTWRTRVFKNSNFMRFHYGVSFQFNGLKPEGNQTFVPEGGQTTLQEFEYDLDKSKFRMDNLVVPVYLEFGPSRYREYKDHFRYSLDDQFRIGLGGYAGFNLGARQKLKYDREGERAKDKLKRGYNTSDLVYGLAGYVGVEGVLLYAKYDLNPIFENAEVDEHNISLGLRFDL
ncbi:hypothetical protein [Robiginitalea sp. SC105]|uniref:hypothetical protein n=1 Tax=Robiginitalea sp. SC105 TaxID=2762332 RepID=UPI00163AF6CE|nr:hypothetical protein [Robiginitalea sp. SC105]MBC2838965.1 hypothetical protein [Robiginitalea sp. SC105]